MALKVSGMVRLGMKGVGRRETNSDGVGGLRR